VSARVKGGVLSTVVVVAVLMLLMVMAVIALWEADFLLFSRANHMRMQRANTESAFTLYCLHPEVVEHDSVVVLYDSVPASRMTITRRPWGLYEVVTAETADGSARRSAIVGLRQPLTDDCVLWYRNNEGAVTLAGETYIKGSVRLPDNGVAYGQLQSEFFRGERLSPDDIHVSDKTMPQPLPSARAAVEALFDMRGTAAAAVPDSLVVSFRRDGPEAVAARNIEEIEKGYEYEYTVRRRVDQREQEGAAVLRTALAAVVGVGFFAFVQTAYRGRGG
jgi:hypothetical protein